MSFIFSMNVYGQMTSTTITCNLNYEVIGLPVPMNGAQEYTYEITEFSTEPPIIMIDMWFPPADTNHLFIAERDDNYYYFEDGLPSVEGDFFTRRGTLNRRTLTMMFRDSSLKGETHFEYAGPCEIINNTSPPRL
jgi:hypothetical protein